MPAAALALLLLAFDLPANEITIDVDALSLGVTYARRVTPSVLVGGGLGAGLSPLLGKIYASSAHFTSDAQTLLLETAAAQGLVRFELSSYFRLDAGARAGLFVHGGEDFAGGPFVTAFASPAIGRRWFWIGPRFEGGWLFGDGGSGPSSAAAVVDILSLRFTIAW